MKNEVLRSIHDYTRSILVLQSTRKIVKKICITYWILDSSESSFGFYTIVRLTQQVVEIQGNVDLEQCKDFEKNST